ncbi:hypothetical protein ACUN7V_15470 [Quadrisphaera oryzae]|uniref:hypothetical protein n=1 Tax=Quadrisphaera TaxID=317661 RepID=UPI001644A949|nr:hypothetical protein [Quadrisphaera sp. RL12-1S]MBC3760610.1 hypothetical protein [Quadrisphaera sp. RL12-1S]
MSTTDDTQTPPDDQTPDPADHAEETPSGKRAQRERAQAAETRAEQAETRVAALQRREVARLASAHLADGADLLEPALGGAELQALLGEDGLPDAELIEAAAAAMLGKRPYLGATRRRASGSPDGGAREPVSRARGWGEVLRAQR